MGGNIALLIPIVALSIPIIAIVLSHKKSTSKDRIRELELKKEIMELEIVRQNSQIKLLEAENRKLDKEINAS